jgi:glycosyltransferase involved in cell wall biosynthesis
MITFVIPSIGRSSLAKTLLSLTMQSNPEWRCIVGFDGIAEGGVDDNIAISDERISYLYFHDKLGRLKTNKLHGNAGAVRNRILEHVQTDWVALVDDDDTLISSYIRLFEEEMLHHLFDCLVFRMRLLPGNTSVLPPIEMGATFQKEMQCKIGISFCFNRSFQLQNDIKFVNSETEDFSFLNEIDKKGGKIHISRYVAYNVGGCGYEWDAS